MLPTEVRKIAEDIAAKHKIPTPNLLAIIDVESNGKVFSGLTLESGRQAPMVLFEPHLMYRFTEGTARSELVAEGLASKKWNRKLYAKTQAGRWQQIERAAEIAGEVAYEAASYGVGQVLGQHWKALGFSSVKAFVDRMTEGAEGQIEIMMKYITVNGLVDELRDGRWPAFFRGYNGPAWEKNGYGVKVEAALRKYGGSIAQPDGLLRLGAKGARVRELQSLLRRAGHPVTIDSDFGPATKKALIAFQKAHGLKTDGVYGPATERALGEYRQSADDKPGRQNPLEIEGVRRGAAAGGSAVVVETIQSKVDEAAYTLQGVDGFQPYLGWGLAALSFVALCLAGYGGYLMLKGWLDSQKTEEV